MKYRGIENVYPSAPMHMVGDGFRVSTYFPSNHFPYERLSPFFLMDYHPPYAYPPTNSKQRGVGAHPHRGFETVTIAYEGAIAHHDSAGHSGVIYPGDVQWMTAGSGVLHTEYHEESFAKQGGVLHEVQLWVNLPSAHKMTQPKYQPITRSQMGVAELPNNAGTVRVIAGRYQEAVGPASTFTPIHMYNIELREKGLAPFTLPADYNTCILILSGQVKVNGGGTVKAGDLVLFKNEEGEILLEGVSEEAKILLLSGEPINEPIAAYGPFVMNTREELVQAVEDFNAGRFGVLED